MLTAFGTTSKAISTYTALLENTRKLLPGEQITLSYTSRVIGKKLSKGKGAELQHPREMITSLADLGVEKVIVQSLHLFPGTEFHKLVKETRSAQLPCAVGAPLLTSQSDYQVLAELLRPTIEATPEQAILILGHGTIHPSWTGYYTLEKVLRMEFGNRVFVGVVEKFPSSDHLPEEIKMKGFKEVTIIPLFLIAGMHFKRDIISDDDHSWKSRLEAFDLTVYAIDTGIGLLPGIEKLVAAHIIEAQNALTSQKTG